MNLQSLVVLVDLPASHQCRQDELDAIMHNVVPMMRLREIRDVQIKLEPCSAPISRSHSQFDHEMMMQLCGASHAQRVEYGYAV